MPAPTEYRRKRSRIDSAWRPSHYITEAGNALLARHTPEYRLAASLTTETIRKAMTRNSL